MARLLSQIEILLHFTATAMSMGSTPSGVIPLALVCGGRPNAEHIHSLPGVICPPLWRWTLKWVLLHFLWKHWETMALERSTGRLTVRKGIEAFEAERRHQVDLKCQERKRRQEAAPPPTTLPCDYGRRLFCHRLGLLGHMRGQKWHQKDS